MHNPKTKNHLTKDVTFLHKSYGEWSKIEKPVLVFMSFKGSDDDDEVETVCLITKIIIIIIITM